ncbi:hypothetical protein B0H14DRAFT_2573554 [Mycena olivaceomarginata]|nr:hypothetical protein B0H14DRAFT_2573554 [Mycena olivaceomarginata]
MWAMKEIGGNLPQLDQFGLAEGNWRGSIPCQVFRERSEVHIDLERKFVARKCGVRTGNLAGTRSAIEATNSSPSISGFDRITSESDGYGAAVYGVILRNSVLSWTSGLATAFMCSFIKTLSHPHSVSSRLLIKLRNCISNSQGLKKLLPLLSGPSNTFQSSKSFLKPCFSYLELPSNLLRNGDELIKPRFYIRIRRRHASCVLPTWALFRQICLLIVPRNKTLKKLQDMPSLRSGICGRSSQTPRAAEKPSQNSGNTANAGTYGKLSARKIFWGKMREVLHQFPGWEEVPTAKEICGSRRSVDGAHFYNSEHESLAEHRSAKGRNNQKAAHQIAQKEREFQSGAGGDAISWGTRACQNDACVEHSSSRYVTSLPEDCNKFGEKESTVLTSNVLTTLEVEEPRIKKAESRTNPCRRRSTRNPTGIELENDSTVKGSMDRVEMMGVAKEDNEGAPVLMRGS